MTRDWNGADQLIMYAIVGLVSVSMLSLGAYVVMSASEADPSTESATEAWIDPVVEIEDENHSHTDLLAHRLSTSNMQLIDSNRR